MPTKVLASQANSKGTAQESYRFGGGEDVIFANADGTTNYTFGYVIDGFKGSDVIYGSDFAGGGDTNLPHVSPETDSGDLLIGGEGSDTVYGGGGGDTIYGGNPDGSDGVKGQTPAPTNTLVGDGVRDPSATDPTMVPLLGEITVSGAFGPAPGDTIYGGNASINLIYGDYISVVLDPGADYTGGNDTLTGGADGAVNNIYGDAGTVTFSADPASTGAAFLGGNDTLTGGVLAAVNRLFGEADSITMQATSILNGGADVLRGGDDAISNNLYGEASTLDMVAGADFNGGADYLRGGDSTASGVGVTNNMFGDLDTMNASGGSFAGGDDKLVGGSGTGVVVAGGFAFFDVDNEMVGDTRNTGGLGAGYQGGNDTLISGAYATDTMNGDWVSGAVGGEIGGADTFVFGLNNGTDFINDFRSSDGDIINLQATGLVWADLDDTGGVGGGDGVLDANDSHVTVNGSDMTIDLGAALGGDPGVNTVKLTGVTSLTASDFDFNTPIDPDALIV